MAKVLGLGGVFFKTADPAKLGEWYATWLGLPVQAPYGAMLPVADLPPGGTQVWAPFPADTQYFAPSTQPFMLNLIVDDVEGVLARVAEGGAQVLPERQAESYGTFGWFIDPAGNKIEVWEPAGETATSGADG